MNAPISPISQIALKAYNDSIQLSVPQIVDELRTALGVRLVAYIAGATSTSPVRKWIETSSQPSPTAVERLRLTYRIVKLIGECEEGVTMSSWFKGMNPSLGDRSPARVLREDPLAEAEPLVLAAAYSFINTP